MVGSAAVLVLLLVTGAALGISRGGDRSAAGDRETVAPVASSPSVTAQESTGTTPSPRPVRPKKSWGTWPPVAVVPTLRPIPPEVLAARARARAQAVADRKAAAEAERLAKQSFSVKVGSFNLLGSQHTAPGGSRQKFPPASVRTPRAAALVSKHGVDILGAQELQADQLRGLQGATGMAAYPGFSWGEAETDNSVLWDPSEFELVEGTRFTITFMGRARPQPIVRLRHLGTGRELYVVNTHPSAGGGQYLAERRRGQAALVAVVRDLKAQGLPVLVTGDMNDRQEFYCQVVAPAGLSAPNGGSYASGCRPPPNPLPVDWVVGSGVGWSGYWRDTTPVTQRTSDHFFISATANVG